MPELMSSAPACSLAVSVAAKCEAALPDAALPPGIWQTIITALLSIFTGCMAPPTPAAAQQHVRDAFHNGKYDAGTFRIATHQARLAARTAGTRLSDSEASVAAQHTLDGIKDADDPTMKEAYTACCPSAG